MGDVPMKTLSGRYVLPGRLSPDDIHLGDLLWALCSQNRYNGQCYPLQVSVGAHTLGLVDYAYKKDLPSEEIRHWLTHDWHEYLVGDIIAPVKALLQPQIGELEAQVDRAIWTHIGWWPGAKPEPNLDAEIYRAEMVLLRGSDYARYPYDQALGLSLLWAAGLDQQSVYEQLRMHTTRLFPHLEERIPLCPDSSDSPAQKV